MAQNFRHTGKRLPVASASADITTGTLVVQEGLFGVALTSAKTGASLWVGAEGVWVITVPGSTAKGNPLFVTSMADAVGVTPTRTAHLGFFIGTAISDIAADNTALVKFGPQGPRAEA
jgi:predicted RecA/RadA family phage recombinase